MNFAFRRRAAFLTLAAFGAATTAVSLESALAATPSTTVTQTVDGRSFVLPEGFSISRSTTTNLVLRPVNASLDDRGRLYLTDSSGSSEDPKTQAKDPQWRVVRLEDTDGDGTYDRSVVVADHLPMLQGILWHPSGLYIGGTPSIWKLSNFDAEGRAGTRTEWWNVGRPSTHCGNEVHGPYDGPDGYLYWTKGAFEPISWTNSLTGKVYHDRAAHIFRAKPDGTEMESVMSGGMDNPVEVAFTPRGELLFTSTFIDFTQPGFRDGVAHAAYGSVFGKENSNVEDRAVKRTGPELMHPIAELGAAAPSGLTRYDGLHFGPAYRDNFFAALFNLRKISRHVLTPVGGTFTAETSDFVVTEDLDFHPTDVLMDGDGTHKVVEYSDLPAALAAERLSDGRLRFDAGSIAVHAFAKSFLDRTAARPDSLPLHLAFKAVPFLDAAGERVVPRAPNAIKFERFIFDLMPLARRVICSQPL